MVLKQAMFLLGLSSFVDKVASDIFQHLDILDVFLYLKQLKLS